MVWRIRVLVANAEGLSSDHGIHMTVHNHNPFMAFVGIKHEHGVCVCVCVCVYKCVCMYICIYVCVCICIYVYMYMYIWYIYVCVYSLINIKK